MADLSLHTGLAGEAAGLPAAHAAGPSLATWRDYVALLKPRVMLLVVFTGFAGLVAAPAAIHPVLAATAVLCIAVASGGAGAINMWYDRDIDAVMTRTRGRPLPRGRIDPEAALAFGVILTFAAVGLMGLFVNWTAAVLLALASAFYIFVYTAWLKRRTPQNIVVGGAAGAFPPMIGWAAATGQVGVEPIVLFAIVFLWTPPHFWALALFRSAEYAKAGVPMLPVVAGRRETKRQILAYTAIVAPLGVLPAALGMAGLVYGAGAALLGALFLLCAVRVWREDGTATRDRAAKQMFGYSVFYLFALFALLIVDHLPAGS